MRLLLSDCPEQRVSVGMNEVRLEPADLAMLYAYPPSPPPPSPARSWVRANFVTTLDGAATGSDGRSGSINTEVDHRVFALLRALSDVVLVGAGTAQSEGYRRARVRADWSWVRDGRAAHPTIAVVSRSARLPARLADPRDNAGDLVVITSALAGDAAIAAARRRVGRDGVLVHGHESVDIAAALDDLAERDLTRVLCEGGPHLMRDVTAAGRLDELCMTIAPLMIAGNNERITVGAAVEATLVPHLLIEADGTLFGSWVRPRPPLPGVPGLPQ